MINPVETILNGFCSSIKRHQVLIYYPRKDRRLSRRRESISSSGNITFIDGISSSTVCPLLRPRVLASCSYTYNSPPPTTNYKRSLLCWRSLKAHVEGLWQKSPGDLLVLYLPHDSWGSPRDLRITFWPLLSRLLGDEWKSEAFNWKTIITGPSSANRSCAQEALTTHTATEEENKIYCSTHERPINLCFT